MSILHTYTPNLIRFLFLCTLLLGNLLPAQPVLAQERAPESPVDAAAVDAITPRALTLNGTDAYVDISHDAALNPSTAATYEAWIYPTNLNGCRTIFGKDYTQGYWVGLCGGRIRFHTGGSAQQDGTTILVPNQWTHIAVVWNPANGQRRYYINGDLEYTGTAGPAPTGSRELRIGDDYSWDFFVGYIAEARLWSVARSQNDIRHTMHIYLNEKMPGLVGAWHFTDSLDDAIGGRVGAGRGTGIGYVPAPQDSLHPFPVHYPNVAADDTFNTLPHRRYSAATVTIPAANRALLIGGNVDGGISTRMDSVDMGTGDVTKLGDLPVGLLQPGAAYVRASDTVYVFGGFGNTVQDAIYAVNASTGAVRTLAAKMNVAASAPAVVYHAGLDKIFLIGGNSAAGVLNTISVFDPTTEQISVAGFSLPTGLLQMGAAYVAATNSIFLFGGIDTNGTAVQSIYELSAHGDGSAGSVTALSAQLPKADDGLNAAIDGKANLIYLLGSNVTEWVLAFDPVTRQIWQTPSKLPATRHWASAVYSERNRHTLVMGGYNSNGQANVWKIALGDGPAVELGRWDFLGFGYTVNDIDGDYRRVIMGMNGNTYTVFANGQGQFSSPQVLGGTNVRLVRYDPDIDRAYYVLDKNTITYDSSSGTTKLWPIPESDEFINDFNPLGNSPMVATDVDNSVPGGHATLDWRWGLGQFKFWHGSWNGCYGSHSLVKRANNETWGLVTEVATCGPRMAPEPRAEAGAGDVYMQGVTYNSVNGEFSEFDYGKICNAGGFKPTYTTEMTFGKNGDFWVSGTGGVCRYPAATVPGTFGVNWLFNVMNTPTGPNSNSVSVDSDGRVWFGVDRGANASGGLTVFEVKGKDANRQSVWTTDYTWLNAPIGSVVRNSSEWDSKLGAVKAVGERVWSARDKQVFTIAQRWQQLDEQNALRAKTIRKVWTVRGRLFVASANELHILQPDGVTWENLAIAGVNAVLADSRGRVWIGSSRWCATLRRRGRECGAQCHGCTGWPHHRSGRR